MIDTQDSSGRFAAHVRRAISDGPALELCGGGTKRFLGTPRTGATVPVDLTSHRGIVSYEPGELVLRARAGTRLIDIERLLAREGQELPFDPPCFADGATLGGAVAAGLSGPARPYRGAVRDAVLGVRMLNGLGEELTFGGQVMKNVAGYDISRLLAGSMGTLGILLDVSLKVLPRPEAEITVERHCDGEEAISQMRTLAASHHPVTATCFDGARLLVRLAGTEGGIRDAARELGGESADVDASWWSDLRDHRNTWFDPAADLWRISVAPATPYAATGDCLVEWGGALRWRKTAPNVDLRTELEDVPGAHLTLFRIAAQDTAASDALPARYHPLPAELMELHRRIKASFDPHGVCNPGRMFGTL